VIKKNHSSKFSFYHDFQKIYNNSVGLANQDQTNAEADICQVKLLLVGFILCKTGFWNGVQCAFEAGHQTSTM
jgi:hypothetical protein